MEGRKQLVTRLRIASILWCKILEFLICCSCSARSGGPDNGRFELLFVQHSHRTNRLLWQLSNPVPGQIRRLLWFFAALLYRKFAGSFEILLIDWPWLYDHFLRNTKIQWPTTPSDHAEPTAWPLQVMPRSDAAPKIIVTKLKVASWYEWRKRLFSCPVFF